MNKNSTQDAEIRSKTAFRVSRSNPLHGELVVPGDKSISHRALMLGSIAQGTTRIEGLLEGEDCLSTARALRSMGVRIDVEDVGASTCSDTEQNNQRVEVLTTQRVWQVHGVAPSSLKISDEPLDLGNSGTGMRLMAGLIAGQGVGGTLIGDESLMTRPMERIAKPLRAMGANVRTVNGKPPIEIEVPNKLNGIDYQSEVASAQVKSAILLAALGAHGTTRVTEPVRSRDHTERMLSAFGCPVNVSDLTVAVNGPQRLQGIDIKVPGDISSAAFFMVAASVIPGSQLTLRHVGINPTRMGVLHILNAMGAQITQHNEKIVHGEPVCDLKISSAQLQGIDVPAHWVPSAIDEFPVLFIAAALAHGTTRVTGAEELKVKESDRLGSMAEGLRTLGVKLVETDDGLEIEGGRLQGGEVQSYGDHRIAMAFAIGACCADEEVTIFDINNVATSFPNFAQIARAAGMVIEVVS